MKTAISEVKTEALRMDESKRLMFRIGSGNRINCRSFGAFWRQQKIYGNKILYLRQGAPRV
jgi:hypothetical protein